MRRLFSNLASNRSGNLEKSVNFQNPQTLAAARTAGCCEWALAQKSANAFLLLLFRRTESLLKSARKRLEILLRGRDATLPRRRPHSGSQGQTGGTFVPRSCGMMQQAGGSGCARLQRASASSGVAAPLGCAALLCICRTDKICCNRFRVMVR